MAAGPARPPLLRNCPPGDVAGGDGARHIASDRSAAGDPGIRDDPGKKRAELSAAYRGPSASLVRADRHRQACTSDAWHARKDSASALADVDGTVQACRGPS